jgi:hypothetical protein
MVEWFLLFEWFLTAAAKRKKKKSQADLREARHQAPKRRDFQLYLIRRTC